MNFVEAVQEMLDGKKVRTLPYMLITKNFPKPYLCIQSNGKETCIVYNIEGDRPDHAVYATSCITTDNITRDWILLEKDKINIRDLKFGQKFKFDQNPYTYQIVQVYRTRYGKDDSHARVMCVDTAEVHEYVDEYSDIRISELVN